MLTKLSLIADYSAKSSYVACGKAIHKWKRFVVKNPQKLGFVACTFFSGLKFGHFC